MYGISYLDLAAIAYRQISFLFFFLLFCLFQTETRFAALHRVIVIDNAGDVRPAQRFTFERQFKCEIFTRILFEFVVANKFNFLEDVLLVSWLMDIQ